jgi:hypothetical protein
MPLSTI